MRLQNKFNVKWINTHIITLTQVLACILANSLIKCLPTYYYHLFYYLNWWLIEIEMHHNCSEWVPAFSWTDRRILVLVTDELRWLWFGERLREMNPY